MAADYRWIKEADLREDSLFQEKKKLSQKT